MFGFSLDLASLLIGLIVGPLGTILLWLVLGPYISRRGSRRALVETLISPDPEVKKALYAVFSEMWDAFTTSECIEDDNGNKVTPYQAMLSQTAQYIHMRMMSELGLDKRQGNKVDRAISKDILNEAGPLMPIIQQYFPSVSEMLNENPQLARHVINRLKPIIESKKSGSGGSAGW